MPLDRIDNKEKRDELRCDLVGSEPNVFVDETSFDHASVLSLIEPWIHEIKLLFDNITLW